MSRYIDANLISRQDAIDALERIFNRCEEIETHLPDGDPDKTGYKMFPDYMIVWKYLRQLPSAQQWIPCSERLPEEEGFYLVSVGAAYNPIRVYEYKPRKMHGQENLWKGSDISYCFNWFVEAWMPLPQPWKGE